MQGSGSTRKEVPFPLEGGAPEITHLTSVLCACARFMGIAEQMGRVLQRTSISVNIKERLDFSCALFGPDGSLVANAPHLPVHLGAMSEAIRYQVCNCAGRYVARELAQNDSGELKT